MYIPQCAPNRCHIEHCSTTGTCSDTATFDWSDVCCTRVRSTIDHSHQCLWMRGEVKWMIIWKTSFEWECRRKGCYLLLYDCNACQLCQVNPDSNLVHSNLVMAANKRVPSSLAIEISSHSNLILIFCNVNGTNMIKYCYLETDEFNH